jgi:hypothetical protein
MMEPIEGDEFDLGWRRLLTVDFALSFLPLHVQTPLIKSPMKFILSAAAVLSLPFLAGCQSHMPCSTCGQSQTGLFTTDGCGPAGMHHNYVVDADYALDKQVELARLKQQQQKP